MEYNEILDVRNNGWFLKKMYSDVSIKSFSNTFLSILYRIQTSNEAKRELCMVWWMLICALVIWSCDMVDRIGDNRMVVLWLIFTLTLTCNVTSHLSLTCNVTSQIDVVHLALKHIAITTTWSNWSKEHHIYFTRNAKYLRLNKKPYYLKKLNI